MLTGYKTYITGALAVVLGVGSLFGVLPAGVSVNAPDMLTLGFGLILGGTVAQWAAVAFKALQVAKFFVALAIGYKTMAGVSWYQAVVYFLDCVHRPKSVSDWTPEDWRNYWDKAQGTP